MNGNELADILKKPWREDYGEKWLGLEKEGWELTPYGAVKGDREPPEGWRHLGRGRYVSPGPTPTGPFISREEAMKLPPSYRKTYPQVIPPPKPETELTEWDRRVNEILRSDEYLALDPEAKIKILTDADTQRQKIIDRQKKAIEAEKKFPADKILRWTIAVGKGELPQTAFIALLYNEGVSDEIIDDIARELPEPMTELEIAGAKRKERGAQILEEIKKEYPELSIPLEEREFWWEQEKEKQELYFKQEKEKTRIEEEKEQNRLDWAKFDLDVEEYGLDKRKELRLAGEALRKFTLDVRQLGDDEAIQRFKEAEAEKKWYWKEKYFPVDNLRAQTYYKEVMHKITQDTEKFGFDKAKFRENIRQFDETLKLDWAKLEDKDEAGIEVSNIFGGVLQKLGTEKQDKVIKLMKSCYDSKGKIIFPKENWMIGTGDPQEEPIGQFLFGKRNGINLDTENFIKEVLKQIWPDEVKGYLLQCRNDEDIWQGMIEKGTELGVYGIEGEEGEPSVWYKPWTWGRKETVEAISPEVTPTSPFPEYPDAYQENGIWYVMIDGHRYRIEG